MGLSLEYLKKCLITEYYVTKKSHEKHGCCFCHKTVIKRKVKCKGSCPEHYGVKHFIFCTECWQKLTQTCALPMYSYKRTSSHKEKLIDKFFRILTLETNSVKQQVNF